MDNSNSHLLLLIILSLSITIFDFFGINSGLKKFLSHDQFWIQKGPRTILWECAS